MNMKKWTDDKLVTTQDEIDAWCHKHSKASWSGRAGLLIAFIGAFAVSTGVIFLFFDGITGMSFVLIGLGSVACFAWYKTEQQRKLNSNFLEEIKVEIARRTKKAEPAKKSEITENPTVTEQSKPIEKSEAIEESEAIEKSNTIEKN
jgi:uncharacterized OsmC-like protein